MSALQALPESQSGALMAAQTQVTRRNWSSEAMDEALRFCEEIKDAKFIPQHARGDKSSVFFLVSMAKDLGLKWTHALRSFYMTPDGKVGMQGDIMLALLLSNKFRVKLLESTKERATYWIKRPGGDDEFEWAGTYTWAEANETGAALAWDRETRQWKVKHNWRDPANMLRWRSLAKTARVVAADLLGGIYLPDELDDIANTQEYASGSLTARELAEAEADKKAEENPAFAITPKAEAKTAAVVVDMSPVEARNAAFFAAREKQQQQAPSDAECSADDDIPVANGHLAEQQARETEERKKAEEAAERKKAGLRVHAIAKSIDIDDPKKVAKISTFVLGYYSGNPTDAKDMHKVHAALDVLEEALKQPDASAALLKDPEMFGKQIRQAKQPTDNNTAEDKPADSLLAEFPNWRPETASLAREAMKARNMQEPKFVTVLKSFALDKCSDEDARAGLLLYYHSPNAMLLLKYAKTGKGLEPTGALKLVEDSLGHPLTTKTTHADAERAITNALTAVRS